MKTKTAGTNKNQANKKKNRDNWKSKKTNEEKNIKNINNKIDKKNMSFVFLFYNCKPKYFGGNVIISH